MGSDVKMLLNNQDLLVELFNVHLPVVMRSRNSHAASDSERGRAPAADTAVTDDKQGNFNMKKNKKKKKKKKAKGDSNKAVAANWAAGNFAKIMVGSFSIALLLSMALGLGQGGIGGSSPSLLRKRTDQSLAAPTSYIDTTVVDSQDNMRSAEQPGDDANEETIDTAIGSKLELFDSLLAHNVKVKAPWQRITQSRSLPPTSIAHDSISYYYPRWKNGLYCDNDPSQRPSILNDIGIYLFQTVEDCCNHWTADQEDDTCLSNSARTLPSQGTERGIPTTSPTGSGSPAAPDTSDTSQAKDSDVSSSSNPPTSTIHHQDSHHLDRSNHGDNGSAHVNGPATEASNEPTHSLASSPNNYHEKNSDDILKINGDDDQDDLTVDQDGHYIDDTSESHDDNDHIEPTDDQYDQNIDETPDSHDNDDNDNGDDDFYNNDDKDDNHDEYECASDQEKCGCPHLHQTDYRGWINTTKYGTPCERWDADWVREEYSEQQYIDAGLEENFCRNPDRDERAWCFVAGGSSDDNDWDYCSVPICRPVCPVADNTTCGCKDVRQSDYRGAINTPIRGGECQPWDKWENFEDYPNAGLDDNFCRNPTPSLKTDRTWCVGDYQYHQFCEVLPCNPCQCMPPCGAPNLEDCGCPSFLQAENCCDDKKDPINCKCDYLKEACRKSKHFCDLAVDVCCEGGGDQQYCRCGMYEQMCSELPSSDICDSADNNCCDHEGDSVPQCHCDFLTYTANVLGFDYNKNVRSSECLEAASIGRRFQSREKHELQKLYEGTAGHNWFNKTGWLDEKDPCNWFGLTCNNGFLTEINLRNNNLNGFLFDLYFPELKRLDLSENNLYGQFNVESTLILQNLEHIDISKNGFSGHVEMLFSSTMSYANYSHNKFTSAGFKRFNAAYESMRVVDLSSNLIDQITSTLFVNIPPNLEELNLSSNIIRGALPDPFPSLDNLRRLDIANNNINGPLPDLSRSTPRVREIDLSNQKRIGNGGFTGTVSADISRLGDLVVLNLAVNNLTSIPSDLGSLAKLKSLNISSNYLDQTIPPELGKLIDVLDSLDLSGNKLKGLVPEEFDQFVDTSIYLSGNPDIPYPAPLMLCFQQKFDLVNDARMCPPERNALTEFYESAKGQDWTENTLWLDPYESFCKWHGVRCSKNNTVEVNLTNNALSGTLSDHIAELTHLMILDLADNDLMGSIPKEIGRLSKLVRLRLAYNRFGGEMPSDLVNLSELNLAQFHANRISGTMPTLNWTIQTYITDCGNPSDFETSLVCTECTMCCNSQGDCYPQEETVVQQVGFKNYVFFALALLAILLVASGVLALALGAYDKYRNRRVPRENIRSPELTSRDEKYALSTIGEDSTYKFFQGKSWFGWMISLATVGVQIWMLFIFVSGAGIDVSDARSALVYTWKCPRDRVECEFTGDVTLQGWVLFNILMVTYLMKDVINGFKLVALSAKERHDRNTQMRYFVGGTLLLVVTIFTFVVSFNYNYAIATSNTELVANSVIILFITDTDERLYGILESINASWVEGMSCEEERSNEGSESIRDLRREINELRESLQLLQQQMRGGNATQPQALNHGGARSEVSRRSRSSSGGGSDRSRSPPNVGNIRRQRGRRNISMGEF